MSRWSRLIPALAVTLLLAACGQDAADTPFAPAGPAYDGGVPVVGGNNQTPPPDEEPATDATIQSDTTGRGGVPVVGGN